MTVKGFLEFDDEKSEDELSESLLRNVSATVLITRTLDLSRKIKQTKDLHTKLNLLASQNNHLAGLVWSMTQFVKKEKD
jgi:hypothetical protein